MAMNYNNLTPAYDYNKQSTNMQAIGQMAGGGMQSGAIPGQQTMPVIQKPYRPESRRRMGRGFPGGPPIEKPYKKLPSISQYIAAQTPGMSQPPQPPMKSIATDPAYDEWSRIKQKAERGMYQTIDHGPNRLTPKDSAVASKYNAFWVPRGYPPVETYWREGMNPSNRLEQPYKQLPGIPQPGLGRIGGMVRNALPDNMQRMPLKRQNGVMRNTPQPDYREYQR